MRTKKVANRKKAQLCKTSVTFLGQTISAEGRLSLQSRTEALEKLKLPKTLFELRSVLGVFNFCRQWIEDYAKKTSDLQQALKGHTKGTDYVQLSEQAVQQFQSMKQEMKKDPALAYPRQAEFHLFIAEAEGYMSAVLCQPWGTELKPVGYYSTTLDAQGFTTCVKALEAIALAVMSIAPVVLDNQLIIHCKHALNGKGYMSDTIPRWSKWCMLLEQPHITFTKTGVENVATFILGG